jgi:hypothetical protein
MRLRELPARGCYAQCVRAPPVSRTYAPATTVRERASTLSHSAAYAKSQPEFSPTPLARGTGRFATPACQAAAPCFTRIPEHAGSKNF